MDALIRRDQLPGHLLWNSTPGDKSSLSPTSHPVLSLPSCFLTSPQPEGRTQAFGVWSASKETHLSVFEKKSLTKDMPPIFNFKGIHYLNIYSHSSSQMWVLSFQEGLCISSEGCFVMTFGVLVPSFHWTVKMFSSGFCISPIVVLH